MTDKKNAVAGGQPATAGQNVARGGAGSGVKYSTGDSENQAAKLDIDAIMEDGGVTLDEPSDELKPALAKAWKLRTLKDAYKPRDPLQYVIDGLFSLPSLNIVYGAPGSLKSMVLADAAVCVAAGQKWLEPLPVGEGETGVTLRTLQAAVLWIDFDNGTRRTDERFDALARARNLPDDIPLHYVSLPDPWLNASSKANVFELSLLTLSLGAKLIVVDNLGLITGEVEENSAQMAGVMGNLRWLAESTGAAVVVIHHQRKSNGTGDGKIRKGETLRGHSSIEAALDLALVVERKPGTDDIAIVPTKERGPTLPIIGAQFTYRHRADSKELETARFWSVAVTTKAEQEINAILAQILVELERHKANGTEPTQKQLSDAVRDELSLLGTGPGVNKVRGAIKRMVAEGAIIETEGVNKSLLYRLV